MSWCVWVLEILVAGCVLRAELIRYEYRDADTDVEQVSRVRGGRHVWGCRKVKERRVGWVVFVSVRQRKCSVQER